MAFSEVPRRKGVVSMATAVLILGAGSSLLIYGGEVPAAQAQSTARPVGTSARSVISSTGPVASRPSRVPSSA